MTFSELLTLLGLAWPRLLIYPGGLAALLLGGLLGRLARAHTPATPLPPAQALGAVALPWLGLALLPLPFAPPLGRKTDLLVAIALLEWPQLLAIRRELGAASPATRAAGLRRLAATLNGMPTLVLAGLALAQAAGTFDLAPMMRPLANGRPADLLALHWLGALGLTLALAPVLGLGPFAPGVGTPAGSAAGLTPAQVPEHAPPRPNAGITRFSPRRLWPHNLARRAGVAFGDGLRLRAAGWLALAAMPWLGPSGALEDEGPRGALVYAACVLVPLVLLGWVWAFDRLAASHSARRWAWLYLALDALLLGALAWSGYVALLRR